MSSPSHCSDEFCFKLQTLASRHEQMKITYQELKSQINACLHESHENFVSLAIPLMKLVGLKNKEMAEEGRYSTIIIDTTSSHGLESQSSGATTGGEQDYPTAASQGQTSATRATIAGRELVEKQHKNLAQLVHLLKEIEKHVNCQQDEILENLSKHRLHLYKYFHKAISYIVSLNNQNTDTSSVTPKLLQAIAKNVNAVLGSLEGGVNDLIEGLAEKMCNPMVEYVKRLTNDMKKGTSRQLLVTLKEMEEMTRRVQLELEDARKKVRVAEEGKLEAVGKLKAIEGMMKRMKPQLSLPEPQRRCLESIGPASSNTHLREEEKDDKLLWKLLDNKRKDNIQKSPLGPEGLLWVNANNKRCARPSSEYTRVTRSHAKTFGLQTPTSNVNWIPLGSSPSSALQPGVKPFSAQTRVTRSKAAAFSTNSMLR